MRNVTGIITLLAIAVLSLGSAAAADSPTTKATVTTGLASMPLAFTENQGQWDEQILFRTNAGGTTMWFNKDGAYYQFTRRISSTKRREPTPRGGPRVWQALPLSTAQPLSHIAKGN